MDYIYDAPYADRFLCNGELNWHDFYYITPDAADEHSCIYQLHRTGIEREVPSLFSVSRTARTPYCEIFCILSGKGKLSYRGKQYTLFKDQIIFMNSHEAHSYESDPKAPLGMIWIEFLGSDSPRLMDAIIQTYSPVAMGEIFPFVSGEISLIQQHLMANTAYQPSADLYRLLLRLYQGPLFAGHPNQTTPVSWQMLESYIQLHLHEQITNAELARQCNISLTYFCNLFRDHYRQTPQEYIRRQRILKSRYLLTRTELPISQITEKLGFCNDSHYCRIFKKSEGMTPLQYRKMYSHP